MNEAQITVSGYVATQPVRRETSTGTPNLTMRVAWTPSRLDRATGEWKDGGTSFVTVICWRKLAENAAVCLRKGDPVLVQGRVSVRDWEDRQGRIRTAVDINAQAIGHDLTYGVANFNRIRPATGKTAAEHAAGLEAGAEDSLTASDEDTGLMASLGDRDLAAGADGRDDDGIFDAEAIGALLRDSAGDADGGGEVAVPV